MDRPNKFALVPSADELGEVERQLAFHPARNPSPDALSREQLSNSMRAVS